MDNKLDKSWKSNIADGSLGRVWLLGASEFQTRALKELNNLDFYGTKESFRDKVEEMLKDLKY